MARISMNEVTTYRWTFEEDVAKYVAAGLDGIGIWRQKLSDYGEEKGAELLADRGLAVSSLSWAGGFTGSDGRSFKESVEDAREALRVAQLVRAPCLVVYTGARAGHTHNHARRLLRTALLELAPQAHEMGISLALEPMHEGCASDWTFLTSLDETLALLNSLDNTAIKLVFDSYHLGQDPQILERIPQLVPRTAIVQVGDARHSPRGEQNRCGLGAGVIPLAPIIQAFLAQGYDGYFDVELLGEEIETQCYHKLIDCSQATLREIFEGGVSVTGPR